MNSPISNLSSSETVVGFLSESPVLGIGCAGYDIVNIFVPSKKIMISNDGRANRSESLLSSKKSEIVSALYIKECNNNKRRFNQDEYISIRNKANEEANEKVHIEIGLVNEIDLLVQERDIIENRKKDIEKRITDLSKQLF